MNAKQIILTTLLLIALLPVSVSYATDKGADPVAHWRFDEGGGPTAYDDTANNNDGISVAQGRTDGTDENILEAVKKYLNELFWYDESDNNQSTLSQLPLVKLQMRQITLSLSIAPFSWLDKEASNYKCYRSNTQSQSQSSGESFKEIACKTNSKYSCSKIKYSFSNKFSSIFVYNFHPYKIYHTMTVLSRKFDFILEVTRSCKSKEGLKPGRSLLPPCTIWCRAGLKGFSPFVIARHEVPKQSPRLLRSLRSLAMTVDELLCPVAYSKGAWHQNVVLELEGAWHHISDWLCPSVYAADKGNPPVAYWRFDEGGGGTAYDDSSNNNDGTLSATPAGTNTAVGQMWTRQGNIGGALELDGTDDYVSATPIHFGTGDFTISHWIKPEVNSRDNSISYGSSPYWTLYIYDAVTPQVWEFEWTGGQVQGTTILTADGKWHFLTVTRSSNTVNLYVDGKFENSGACSVNFAGAASMWIGRNAGASSQYGKGLIDDVHIYNYARTAGQIMVDYNAGMASYTGAGTDPNEGNPPIAYLTMDDGGGTIVSDVSGNGNNGTLASSPATPTWAAGKYGGALSFDGSDDYVNAGQGTSLNGLTSMTLSAWIKPYGYSSNYRSGIISRRRDSGAAEGLNFTMGGALETPYKLAIYEAGGGALYANTVISPNQWSFVTATLSGTNAKIYINGVLDAAGTVSWNWPSDVNVWVGTVYYGSPYYFNGLIDNVKIYNYARTPAQIAWDYNKGKPVAQWRFDEKAVGQAVDTASGAIKDDSDNNNDGTASNTTWSYVAGKFGRCLSFDGNDYINVVHNTNLNITNEMTLSAWVKTSANDVSVISKRDNANPWNGYIFAVGANGGANNGKISYWPGNYSSYAWQYGNSTTVADNAWHHIVAVHSGTTVTFYLDGKSDGSSTCGSRVNNSNNDLRISTETEGVRAFTGIIDDVRIYNYARTAAQIQQDYNQGLSTKLGD